MTQNKLYENHTLVTNTWRRLVWTTVQKTGVFIALFLVSITLVITAPVWWIGLGYIPLLQLNLRYWELLSNALIKCDEEGSLEVMKVKFSLLERVPTKEWLDFTRISLVLLGLFPLALVSGLGYIIWLVTLGHLHLYKPINSLLIKLGDQIPD